MSIRQRIIFLMVSIFIAISAIGGYAVYQSRSGAVEVKGVTEITVPSAMASADLVSHLKNVQMAAMDMVSASDANLLAQAQQKLVSSKTAMQTELDFQEKNAKSAAQKGLVDQARESAGFYFTAIEDTARLKAAGKDMLAQANMYGNVEQYQVELKQIVETLRIEKNREMTQAIGSLNENLSRTVNTVTSITISAVLVLMAIGILLYRQISRPLSRMKEMMVEIASSQDFSRRMPVERMDEVGLSVSAFNVMIEKIEESSEALRKKTADIQAMLQNIHQGILTVVDDAAIHPEYSAHLESIFETRDIAGRPLMDLVFSNTNLGADELAQIEAASQACLGEDIMNFEFNRHLLATEIAKRMPDGRNKILDLSWSPIADAEGTIERLMLCIRDVTELRQLAAEANEQKQKLEIIGEILGVTQEKFHEFIQSATDFIEDNVQIVAAHEEHDIGAVSALFRNMHTIKGNARTYGLHHLTNIVHQAEQSYEELRQADHHVWSQDRLMKELQHVQEHLELYATINEVSLGRKGPGRRGEVERYLMVDRDHIQDGLRMLEATDSNDLQALQAMRKTLHRSLRMIGTETIFQALAGVIDSLPSLATELGKAAPIVHIDDNGYLLRNQISALLRNVFMHLLRNSLDHGIETAEERSIQGKKPAGTIEIEAGVDSGMLQISLCDDGRGLALDHIRRMAMEKGWGNPDKQASDEEVAQMIFRPGFSTAPKITEVSGRGVGMDAVLDLIKKEGGNIELRFTDECVGAEYRQFEITICLPDQFAIDGAAVQVESGAVELHLDAFAGNEAARKSIKM
jgi:HPt (histidine-containing phosphotransfer) domain-containing protein/HAMP domain-containing protein